MIISPSFTDTPLNLPSDTCVYDVPHGPSRGKQRTFHWRFNSDHEVVICNGKFRSLLNLQWKVLWR